MTDEPQNIVLEHLRYLRRTVDDVKLDIVDMKSRMSGTEILLGQIVSLLAAQSGRMDRIDERLARVERRLDLIPA